MPPEGHVERCDLCQHDRAAEVDALAIRLANAYLTDDLLEAVVFKWAAEVAS